VLTAFAAGVIDVLSFAKLGGAFTSAMTGNLALLGFYVSTGAAHSAINSMIALAGFIVGCAVGTMLGRNRTTRSAVRRLLGLETLAITACAIVSIGFALALRTDLMRAEIAVLAFAMGMQSIVGAKLDQTTIVFTMTLVKIVSALTGSSNGQSGANDRRREAAVVITYLFGALTAGVAIATHFAMALFIPAAAVGAAFFYARSLE
jgi:uncharacterized membrane protein YoaK (UPF0700 family)